MLINLGEEYLKIISENVSQFMKLILSEINQYIFLKLQILPLYQESEAVIY